MNFAYPYMLQITLPAQPGTMNSESRVLTIHVPASALQENQLTQILTAHLISSIMSLPTTLASSVLQQHVNAALVNANMQSKLFSLHFRTILIKNLLYRKL